MWKLLLLVLFLCGCDNNTSMLAINNARYACEISGGTFKTTTNSAGQITDYFCEKKQD